MFPVAATGLSRCCDEDTVLGGYFIPAGTEVQVRMHAMLISFAACLRHQQRTVGRPQRRLMTVVRWGRDFTSMSWPQVPIYTLHMLTFPHPERFWPERWTDGSVPRRPSAGSTAPAEVQAQVQQPACSQPSLVQLHAAWLRHILHVMHDAPACMQHTRHNHWRSACKDSSAHEYAGPAVYRRMLCLHAGGSARGRSAQVDRDRRCHSGCSRRRG